MADKYAVLVLGNDPEASQPQSRGRMVHAMHTARALHEAGAEVKLFFEGAGVKWLERFHLRDDKFTQHYGESFDAVRPLIAGACDFCARVRFSVAEHAAALEVPLVAGPWKHSATAALALEGYQVITY